MSALKLLIILVIMAAFWAACYYVGGWAALGWVMGGSIVVCGLFLLFSGEDFRE